MSSWDVVVQRSWFTETRFIGSLPFDLFQFRLVHVNLQLHAPSIKRQKQMSWSSVVKYSHIKHVNISASFILPLWKASLAVTWFWQFCCLWVMGCRLVLKWEFYQRLALWLGMSPLVDQQCVYLLLSINPSDQSSSFVAILSFQTLHGGNNYNTQNRNYQYQYIHRFAGVVFLPVITGPCLCTILLEVK